MIPTTLYVLTTESWYASARIDPACWRAVTHVEMDWLSPLRADPDESRALRLFNRARTWEYIRSGGIHVLRVRSTSDVGVMHRAPIAGDDADWAPVVRAQSFETDQ
jgi:hypothetical protein